MDPEDFVSPEVGITAAVVAVIASPRVRKVVRRGAVLGLSGILMAGDAVTAFAHGVGQGAQRMNSASVGSGPPEAPSPSQSEAHTEAEQSS